jgi:hypothetical protein
MLLVLLAAVLAQAPPQAGVAVTVAPRIESLRYRFENPSSFDTAELVPHFFEQTYGTSNVWAGLRARYQLFRIAAESSVEVTPQVTGRADDLDTFFQPDGNVIVSGTVGNASLRGWNVAQRLVVGRTRIIEYGVGYGYRRDTARYHDGTRITRTTVPQFELRETVTTREFVTSQVHEAKWFVRWAPERSRLSLFVEAAPFAVGRLAIELPDKYPGRLLVFSSRTAMLRAEVTRNWTIGGLDLELAGAAERSFSYSSRARMRLQGVSIVLRAGTR